MRTRFSLPHALTIDAEDWSASMHMYSGHEEKVSAQFASYTSQALDLLDEYGVRATSFVVTRQPAHRYADALADLVH